MSMGPSNNYRKTDFDFSTAKSVIRGVYHVAMCLTFLGALCGFVMAISENKMGFGLWTLAYCLVSGLLLHVGYSFLVGFFELIKHAREIRDELAALRAKSGAPTPAPVEVVQTASTGATRYDPVSHQYVKA